MTDPGDNLNPLAGCLAAFVVLGTLFIALTLLFGLIGLALS